VLGGGKPGLERLKVVARRRNRREILRRERRSSG
jgi:hypothetical protein